MSQFEQSWQRFKQAPRAVQWLIGAVVALVLFFFYTDVIKTTQDRWSSAADRIESDIAAARDSQSRIRRVQMLKGPIEAFGRVSLPESDKESREAMNRAVNGILEKHKSEIQNSKWDARGETNLPQTVLRGLYTADKKAESISGEFRFESAPAVAMQIIAELEASPDIEAISSVQISKQAAARGGGSSGRLSVILTLEAWAFAPKK